MHALSSMTDKLKEELAHQEMQKWWIIQNINWYLQLIVHIKFQNQFAHGKVLVNNIANCQAWTEHFWQEVQLQ